MLSPRGTADRSWRWRTISSWSRHVLDDLLGGVVLLDAVGLGEQQALQGGHALGPVGDVQALALEGLVDLLLGELLGGGELGRDLGHRPALGDGQGVAGARGIGEEVEDGVDAHAGEQLVGTGLEQAVQAALLGDVAEAVDAVDDPGVAQVAADLDAALAGADMVKVTGWPGGAAACAPWPSSTAAPGTRPARPGPAAAP